MGEPAVLDGRNCTLGKYLIKRSSMTKARRIEEWKDVTVEIVM